MFWLMERMAVMKKVLSKNSVAIIMTVLRKHHPDRLDINVPVNDTVEPGIENSMAFVDTRGVLDLQKQ